MNKLLFWLTVLLSGMLFGMGLAVSTMIQPEVVLSFLVLHDLGLLLVLGCATGITLMVYQLAPRLLKKPLLALQFSRRPDAPLKRTLAGAALFGIGWGVSGVCPGPAIAGLGAGNWPLLVCLLAMLAGAWLQGRFFSS